MRWVRAWWLWRKRQANLFKGLEDPGYHPRLYGIEDAFYAMAYTASVTKGEMFKACVRIAYRLWMMQGRTERREFLTAIDDECRKCDLYDARKQ